ncbi:unnamed protein product [Rotaria sordida]|uniref:NAD(P)(+)--arginine ADP-ribosyltransferase n=1 Tax=Rotaria sordida TaxID=392033 RepID=A0A816CB26_9BILA|nr:unnamed protein product [Rotaria sordida]CAF1619263.1 unnamed protein product [Rotaria sordida]
MDFRVSTTKKPLGIALAFYSGLWAYDGWNCLNAVTEELKNPKRNLWLAIILALPSIIVIYLLTNISYFTVMDKATLLSSDAVAVTWGNVVLGPVVRILPILISISALGGCNGSLFMSGRYCMVGARYGYLPEVFACIQKQRLTPLPAIVLEGILSMVYCIPSNIQSLIEFFSFVAWMFYGLTFVATLCCKFTKKEVDRVISVPIPLIIIIILISIYLVISPVISNPNIGFLVALILILFGLIFYYPFVYRKIELKFIQQINAFLKRCFQLEKADINMKIILTPEEMNNLLKTGAVSTASAAMPITTSVLLELVNPNETQPTVKTPLSGYEKQPLMSLEEALKPVDHLIEDLRRHVAIAKKHCTKPKDGLTQDESASIMVYGMEWEESPLYKILNVALRSDDRHKIKPWFPYLKLFMTALHKLPSFQGIVWRAVQIDLSNQYSKGQRMNWWSVSSTTRDASVFENFIHQSGKRTVFTIECKNGKLINNHSQYPSDDEVLLMPGFYFEVTSVFKPAVDMYIISLKEIDSPW